MTDSRPTSTRRRALKLAGMSGFSGVAGLTGLSLTSKPALAISGPVNLPSGLTEGTVNVSSYEIQYAELDTASDITITYILRTQSETVKETHTVSITESTGAVMSGSHSINVPAGEVTLEVQLEHPSVGTVSTQESAATTVSSAIPDSVVHRYRFEEDVTDSVGSRGGTTNGGTAYETTDPIEGSASIVGDGTDDEVNYSSNVSVDPTQDGIAYEFWATFDSVSSGDVILDQNDQSTRFALDFNSDGVLRGFYQSTGNNPTVTVSNVQTGTEYRVVLQYDPSTNAIELGLDGSVDDSNTNGDGLNNPTDNNQFLAGYVGGSQGYAAGTFDDLRIHDQPIL